MYIIPASPMQGGLPPHLFPLWIRFWFSCLFNDSQRALIFIAFQSFLLLPFVDQRIGSTAWVDRVDIYRDIPNHSPVRDILQDHPLFVLLFSLLISCVILLVFYSILHSFLHFSGAICDPTGLLLFTPRNADNHFLTSQLFKLCLDITKKTFQYLDSNGYGSGCLDFFSASGLVCLSPEASCIPVSSVSHSLS